MSEYKYFGKGWSGKRYYMEMTMEETRERERLKLILGVIVGMPVMGVIMALAAGVI